jgi:hypothetical protein
VFSVAVKGYGIVLWDEGCWRTFSPSESLAAILAVRVENAVGSTTGRHENEIRDALLQMSGAFLLASDFRPDCCDENGALS